MEEYTRRKIRPTHTYRFQFNIEFHVLSYIWEEQNKNKKCFTWCFCFYLITLFYLNVLLTISFLVSCCPSFCFRSLTETHIGFAHCFYFLEFVKLFVLVGIDSEWQLNGIRLHFISIHSMWVVVWEREFLHNFRFNYD